MSNDSTMITEVQKYKNLLTTKKKNKFLLSINKIQNNFFFLAIKITLYF